MPRTLSLEYLRERWVEARELGPWNLLLVPLVCVPLVLSVLLIGQGVDLLHARVPGSVTIVSCESTKGGWNCDGPFTSADGSLRIDWVRVYPYFAQDDRPTGTVAARVSGADATQANRANEAFPVPLWGGIAIGLVGLYWVWSVYLNASGAGPTALRRRRPSRRP